MLKPQEGHCPQTSVHNMFSEKLEYVFVYTPFLQRFHYLLKLLFIKNIQTNDRTNEWTPPPPKRKRKKKREEKQTSLLHTLGLATCYGDLHCWDSESCSIYISSEFFIQFVYYFIFKFRVLLFKFIWQKIKRIKVYETFET